MGQGHPLVDLMSPELAPYAGNVRRSVWLSIMEVRPMAEIMFGVVTVTPGRARVSEADGDEVADGGGQGLEKGMTVGGRCAVATGVEVHGVAPGDGRGGGGA